MVEKQARAKTNTVKAKPKAKAAPKKAPVTAEVAPTKGGNYFTQEEKDVAFIPTGSTLLDCVVSGGWALGRVVNIVGDKSAGKTLLAIEACANFAQKYPDGQIWYNEAEAAFDEGYAEALGLPVDDVFFVNGDEPKDVQVTTKIKEGSETIETNDSNHTVEGLFEHLGNVCNFHKKNDIKNGLYVIDSLDAFSDRAELEREIDKGTYGQNKAKKMSELFRRLVRKIEDVNLTVIVISQVRDNIGVTFGATKTRSGGRALDFYASQVVWLAEAGKIKKTMSGIERVVGVKIKAKCKKNKVGIPFRECDYPIEFGYGVDDLLSCAEWLATLKDSYAEEHWKFTKSGVGRAVTTIKKKDDESFFEIAAAVSSRVKERWMAIEEGFMPVRRKYKLKK